MGFIRPAFVLLALAACAPTASETNAGVGFSDYNDYARERSARDIALSGQSATPGPTVSLEQVTGGTEVPSTTGSIAGQTRATANNPGISDEQSFDAVSDRETIQSDRQRIEAQREAYRVIQPTAVPNRPGSSGPNIVQFALTTNNRLGEQIYSRSGFSGENRYNRNCAKYASPDLAQEDFLSRGGPERDRLGIDPDGDGFACGWDPSPFRRVRG